MIYVMPAPAASASDATTTQLPRHVGVLIAGAGFSGIGLAVRLQQSGYKDFLVIERAESVGGTWRDNHYPGAACDVPSNLYSFSFAPNPNWSRAFSPQKEIHNYLIHTADKFKINNRIVLNTTMESATWDSDRDVWVVKTSRGEFTATIFVSAVGALSEPALPEIKGIETFKGKFFHSAQWDHDTSLAGKKVAVIGTGASAIQIVPELVKVVEKVDIYQRTPPWIMPRGDRPYSDVERAIYKWFPLSQQFSRLGMYLMRECGVWGLVKNPEILTMMRQQASAFIAYQVKSPELRRKVTPTWQIGCKRILISNDWYPALQKPNAELVTEGIAEIREHSVVTKDGKEREVDAIVVATGFHTADHPIADKIVGSNGRSLHQVWAETGNEVYKGTTIAGFPNLFFMTGPNTGLGHTSQIYMIESQVNYVISALNAMKRFGLATVEVRKDKQDSYNKDVQEALKTTVWSTGGCSSWYQNAHGKNVSLWPNYTFVYRNMTRQFDLEAYLSTALADKPAGRPASLIA